LVETIPTADEITTADDVASNVTTKIGRTKVDPDITTTNDATTANDVTTSNPGSTDAVRTTSSLDNLSIGKALSEGGLQINASVELLVIALIVEVDDEHLRFGGRVRHLDDLLLVGARTLVEHVHDGLLLGRGAEDWPGLVMRVLGAHEDVVHVHLGLGEVPGRDCPGYLGRDRVQEQVGGNLRRDTVTVGVAHLATGAAVAKAYATKTSISSSNAATDTATRDKVATAGDETATARDEARVPSRREEATGVATRDETSTRGDTTTTDVSRGDEVVEAELRKGSGRGH